MRLLTRIASEVLNRPLACTPQYLDTVLGVLAGRIGIEVDASEASAADGAFEARPQKVAPADSAVAVIPVLGSLTHRAGQLDAMSGVTSYRSLSARLQAAADDPAVGTIILEIDSPGGAVIGLFDFVDDIDAIAARDDKEVIALVDGTSTSAAYAIASAANRIYATQTSQIGSIGVVMAHTDLSEQLKMDGVKKTFIYAGQHKVDGNSTEPLPDGVRERLQASVDEVYDKFVSVVARGRGIEAEAVRATEAAVFMPERALELGLIDGIRTVDEVISEALELAQPKGPRQMKDKLFSQQQVDELIAAAVAESTSVSASAIEQAVAGERDRISAILASDEYAGRETLGQLLIDNGTSAEAAVQILAAAPNGGGVEQPAQRAESAQEAAIATLVAESPGIDADPEDGVESSAAETRIQELRATARKIKELKG